MNKKLAVNLMVSLSVLSACAVNASTEMPIALQMFTLRDSGTLDQQFAIAEKAGFHAVELVSDHGVSAHEMKNLLAKHHLKAVSDHVQLDDLENHSAKIISFNKAIGNNTLVMPWLDLGVRPKTAAEWKQMGQRLDAIGKKLNAQGMTLAYHNHNFEMKKYDGETALDILMASSSPKNLKLELDAAWASRGGQDPATILSKYKGRVFAIHAKDNSAIGVNDDKMNFAPAGQGLLDWQEILPAAESAGAKWYIVEHDKPGNDAESIITEANQFLQKNLKPITVK